MSESLRFKLWVSIFCKPYKEFEIIWTALGNIGNIRNTLIEELEMERAVR